MPIYKLPKDRVVFPDPAEAEPDGLLAMGGTLSPESLLTAYSLGIFPWYSKGEPILWWSLNPRCVLFPEDFHLPRSLQKTLKNNPFTLTFDTAFSRVIGACAKPRGSSVETWLVPEMISAYTTLHKLGFAHSVEAWQDGELVGGAYGLALGKIFCGESMFYLVPNASKVAFAHLANALWSAGFQLIDCQQKTDNLVRFGARCIERAEFMQRLQGALACQTNARLWQGGIPL